MHGKELHWIGEAIRANWVSPAGENIRQLEKEAAALTGRGEAIALSSGTAALHLGVRLAGGSGCMAWFRPIEASWRAGGYSARI